MSMPDSIYCVPYTADKHELNRRIANRTCTRELIFGMSCLIFMNSIIVNISVLVDKYKQKQAAKKQKQKQKQKNNNPKTIH